MQRLKKIWKEFLFGVKYWYTEENKFASVIPFVFCVSVLIENGDPKYIIFAIMTGLLVFLTFFAYFFFIPSMCHRDENDKIPSSFG